jgi:hypothetical protein
MLFERDRRSGNIEIRNAEKEGDCTLHFSFQSGPGLSPMVVLLLPQECRRADESTRCWGATRSSRHEQAQVGDIAITG